MRFLSRILGLHTKPTKPGGCRDPRWPKVRDAHLLREPLCQVCGRKDFLQAHHVLPFHTHPELELAEGNLLTLCEPSHGGCHLLFGHLGNFQSWNPYVRRDAHLMRERIKSRPSA